MSTVILGCRWRRSREPRPSCASTTSSSRLEARDTAWYNDDQQYRSAVGEALETLGFVADFLEFNETRLECSFTPEQNAPFSLWRAHRDVINHLEARWCTTGADTPDTREAALTL